MRQDSAAARAQRAIESGVRKYLTKPTDPVDLIAALEQIEREQCEQIQRLQRQAQKEPDLKPVDNLLVLRPASSSPSIFSGTRQPYGMV